jgi:parallel beta-helix repeat protein
VGILGLTTALLPFCLAHPQAKDERPPVTLRQAEGADVVGNDDQALQRAADRLKDGGTLVIGPGRYVLRRTVFLPADLVLRGEPGAVLALPAPVLSSEAARAGSRELVLAERGELAERVLVQILPPVSIAAFGDGSTKSLELQQVVRLEGTRVFLRDPLPVDVPAGSRVGYSHKLLWVDKQGRTSIEDLAFEGGRVAAIPMPGHSQRCAIWASAPFGFGEQRLGPPGQGVAVRRCAFRDWYGRGVAFYNQENGVVEDCLFERIDDEAIDLDHFVERFRVAGNTIRGALWGIVLNDASRNTIESNRIEDCEIGIWSWWYERTPRQGINEENVIRGNEIRGARKHAIHVAKTCVRYVIQDNAVQGSILVEEADNTVGPNRQL